MIAAPNRGMDYPRVRGKHRAKLAECPGETRSTTGVGLQRAMMGVTAPDRGIDCSASGHAVGSCYSAATLTDPCRRGRKPEDRHKSSALHSTPSASAILIKSTIASPGMLPRVSHMRIASTDFLKPRSLSLA